MSSRKGGSSVQSSAGYTSSASTSSSSTLRKNKLPQNRIPPPRMTKEERLTLIRNALTRLRYTLERSYHFSSMDQAGGEEVMEVFSMLQSSIAALEGGAQQHQGTPATGGPQQLEHLSAEVKRLTVAVERAMHLTEKDDSEGVVAVYSGLKSKLLAEVLHELQELQDLLSLKDLSKVESRINTKLLKDMVAIHTDQYDAFTKYKLKELIDERLDEHAHYSRAVYETSSTDADPVGCVSALLLDVAIGVRPSTNAKAVLTNGIKGLEKILRRVKMAERAVDDIIKNHANLAGSAIEKANEENTEQKDTFDSERYENNRREILLLLEGLNNGLVKLNTMSTQWKETEEEIYNSALAGMDVDQLMGEKQLKECKVVEEAQDVYDRLTYAALPFHSPQYHRRFSLTYSSPCHIRLGFHFGPDRSDRRALKDCSPIFVYNTEPHFLSLMEKLSIPKERHRHYDYLVPSEHHCWIPFAEFPEMVGSRRCALYNIDSKQDKFRCQEEQKEVGGYFIVQGGERILRALLMQRANVAVNVERSRFQDLGPRFSERGVTIRCKRPSGVTVYNYFYYSTAGNMFTSFSRRVNWQIPTLLLLLATATKNPSTLEVHRLLTLGMDCSANHKDRVEAIIQNHLDQPYGYLTNFLDYLSVFGRMFLLYHEKSGMTFQFLPCFTPKTQVQHDAWYGLVMLRRHILPHLNVHTSTPDLAPDASTEELKAWLTQELLEELNNKFDALVSIMRQSLSFVDGHTSHQGNDVPAYQEVFTVSNVLTNVFTLAVNAYLKRFSYLFGRNLPFNIFQKVVANTHTVDKEMWSQLSRYFKLDTFGVSNPLLPLTRFLSTGSVNLDNDVDFYSPQPNGWVVIAEHLNFYRFFEQLRCIHRGSTIAGMRSSEVRRYPCESFGFICMVHSPDGEDCGVVNYLTVSARFSNLMPKTSEHKETLQRWLNTAFPRLWHLSKDAISDVLLETVPLWVEGKLVGYIPESDAGAGTAFLRRMKAFKERGYVDANGVVYHKSITPLHTMEVVYVPSNNKEPKGVYVFFDDGRLMRPIQNIETFTDSSSTSPSALPFPLVFVGAWEQMWLDIAAAHSDLEDAVVQLNRKYEFMEQNGSNIISITSATIPFFEYNCSPRNLFQCGLSKQSAGTQLQALGWRREAKLFRMYYPQRYISRTLPMDFYNLDDVNLGVNAVVAILAYTGYDMDDAVILNSTASQRGMLNAGITIGKIVSAHGKMTKQDDLFVFHNLLSTGERFSPELEATGLPPRRQFADLEGNVNFTTDHKYPSLRDNSDVYCVAKRTERIDHFTNTKVYDYTSHKTTKWQHFDKGENAWVHSVVPLAYDGPDPVSVLMIFRIPRPPTVGDKFSSRHGQKGTLPLHIRSHDLPFSSVTGITPDVIINPHAFPSRMTVGMVLEVMTAKVGAIEGRFMDNSAWSTVDEKPRVAEEIGEALAKSGYNRYGRETFIDGVSGEEMQADVFVGISGYQRLRHMVNDKWQARARTDGHKFRAVTKTGQPVHGRKNHGGVRVGEMERDALVSYGMSDVVLDRLLRVSDETKAFVCTECGSLLSIVERHATEHSTWKCCTYCGAGRKQSTDTIVMINVPQVLRLWAAELTSVGVRVILATKQF